ncbi:antibiotic biosynthesis monooxygenase domain-containing [Cordyceps militaris]|uniref:Antibiotic biosynthesis monooxygenase domain-containing n=1 Tax=Cordyceps militaris TaxID=73501 RepID=A0A2H4SHI4_CORMI|nr:antibiotic biosynthesis monooxygenase domain-containing [Cordyceps militaris]
MAENCPDGRVLSVLNLELSEGVDVSDGATAPGKLFKASMEYVGTIPGCFDVKWARERRNVCVLILWDNPLSWRSFQESVGFTRLAPLVTHNIANRSMMLPRVQGSVPKKAERFLGRMEITLQADLDSNARLQFECQVSAIMGDVGTGACRELASGWIEHNAPVSRLIVDQENIPARTECIYLILYESAEDDDIERNSPELRERLGQVPVSTNVKKKFSISPRMIYQDNHEPPSLEPAPLQPQVGTLAGALQRGIRRSALNENMDVATAHLTEYKCYPTDPMAVSQAQLYMRHNAHYTALWRLGPRPNPGRVLPEPYVVDIAWLKARSSLDKIKQRIGKMLDYKIRQLVGYHSGFWVRVADSAHEFGVCTVWGNESIRATTKAEYCEILERFDDGSSYLDAPPVQQSVSWQRSEEADERVSLGELLHIEVITFRVPHDARRRELFEYAFTGFRRFVRISPFHSHDIAVCPCEADTKSPQNHAGMGNVWYAAASVHSL